MLWTFPGILLSNTGSLSSDILWALIDNVKTPLFLLF